MAAETPTGEPPSTKGKAPPKDSRGGWSVPVSLVVRSAGGGMRRHYDHSKNFAAIRLVGGGMSATSQLRQSGEGGRANES